MPHTYYEASVKPRRAENDYHRVLVTQLHQQTSTDGAAKAQTVTSRWDPQYILVVGAATGLAEEVELGDLLVADRIVEYTSEGPNPHPTDSFLLDVARHLEDDWLKRVKERNPQGRQPHRRIGTLLSGDDQLKDAEHLQAIKETWKTLIGVEVAGGGVALGLHQTQSGPGFLVIRGVGALPGEPLAPELGRAWRQYACDIAAAYTVELLSDVLVRARRKTERRWIVLVCAIVILLLFVGLAAFVESHPLSSPSPASAQPERSSSAAPAPPEPRDVDIPPTPLLRPEFLQAPQIIVTPHPKGSSSQHRSGSKPGTSAASGCTTKDFRVDQWRFEARCICKGVVTQRSAPFTPGERDFVLSFESWTCH